MWLPRAERKLLRAYFVKIGEPDLQHIFTLNDFVPQFKPTKPHDPDFKKFDKAWHMIRIANKALAARKLIICREDELTDEMGVQLTINGYDLGRKYNSWWMRTGLWFAEYKDHWFWLILSFLGGIIVALIVNWLSKT
jgi:hypothetical protein